MISICPKCKSYAWNKIVEDNYIICPECGAKWEFIKKPIYFLTGCSGVGKTTIGQEFIRMTKDYVVLDADMFYNIMAHNTEEDYYRQIEQIMSLSKNITQSGKSVLWTMAGNIDKLLNTYQVRFFSKVKVLALTCSKDELRKRMVEGRGITDEGWINSSLEYNEYFRTHDKIGNVKYSKIEIDHKSPIEIAEMVIEWMNANE